MGGECGAENGLVRLAVPEVPRAISAILVAMEAPLRMCSSRYRDPSIAGNLIPTQPDTHPICCFIP